MARYYRVLKDTFLWKKGAILKSNPSEKGYESISDIWDVCELQNEYISKCIVEDAANAEWFERVYEVSILGKAKYATKEKAMEIHNAMFNNDKKGTK